jgi:hypothetical protein
LLLWRGAIDRTRAIVYSEIVMRVLFIAALLLGSVPTVVFGQEPTAAQDPQGVQAAPIVVYVPYVVPYVVYVPVATIGHHHRRIGPRAPLSQGVFVAAPATGLFAGAPATGMFAGNPATGIFAAPPPARPR